MLRRAATAAAAVAAARSPAHAAVGRHRRVLQMSPHAANARPYARRWHAATTARASGLHASEENGDGRRSSEEDTRGSKRVKKRVAMFCGYVGTKFRGLQIQRNVGADETVEAVLEKALYQAGCIAASNYGDLKKVRWTRSSRTDKGVHSVCTVLSLRMLVDVEAFDESDYSTAVAEDINSFLPEEVRVFCVQRVTKSFTARHGTRDRTYHYYIPIRPIVQAFNLRHGHDATPDELIARLRELLALFEGNHAFHNYTDRSRYTAERKRMPERIKHYYAPRLDSTDESSDVTSGSEKDGSAESGAEVCDGPLATTFPIRDETGAAQEGEEEEDEEGPADDTDDDVEQHVSSPLISSTSHGVPAASRREFRSYPRRCWWNDDIVEKDPIVLQHYRHIHSFGCSDVTRIEDRASAASAGAPDAVDAIRIEITGGSFMLYQIRYMIGTAIGTLLGHLPKEIIPATLSAPARFNFLPLAPSSSLLLFDATFHQLRTPSGAEKRYLRLDDSGVELRDTFIANVLSPSLFPLIASDEWETWITKLPARGEVYYGEPELNDVLRKHSEWRARRVEAAIQRRRKREAEAAAVPSGGDSEEPDDSASRHRDIGDNSRRSPARPHPTDL